MNLSDSKIKFINYIDKLISNKKLSHAYLIEIDNYESDLSYIYSFIKMILCNVKYNDLDSCNNNIINLIDSNNYPDLYVIKPDGQTIKKNQMMLLQKEYSNKSLLDNKRIYIIENADKLNSSSANTILKFLEEPEDDIIAILITSNRYQVLETILSRCQILSLKENYLLDGISDDFFDFFTCIFKPNDFFINYKSFVFDDKNIIVDYFNKINLIIVNYLDYKYNNVNIDKGLYDSYFNILEKYDDNYLVNIISIIEDASFNLSYNVNLKLWFDSFFASLILGGKYE